MKPWFWFRGTRCCSKIRVRICSVEVNKVKVLVPSRIRSPEEDGKPLDLKYYIYPLPHKEKLNNILSASKHDI